MRSFVVGFLLVLLLAAPAAAIQGPSRLIDFDLTDVTSVTIDKTDMNGTTHTIYTKQGENWTTKDGQSVEGVTTFLALLWGMRVERISPVGSDPNYGFGPQMGSWSVALELKDGFRTTVDFGGKHSEGNGWFAMKFIFTRVGRGPVMLVYEFGMDQLQQALAAIK